MRLTPHADSVSLSRSLDRCLLFAASWAGTVFRATSIEFATRRALVSGEGAWLHGARWTPKGGFHTWQMQAALKELNARRTARGGITFEMDIGVQCGEVVHGFMGSAERMQFTVIGDAANIASRYCDGAAAGEVLISPEVYQRVWRIVKAMETTIPTKHEGDLRAYSVTEVQT